MLPYNFSGVAAIPFYEVLNLSLIQAWAHE